MKKVFSLAQRACPQLTTVLQRLPFAFTTPYTPIHWTVADSIDHRCRSRHGVNLRPIGERLLLSLLLDESATTLPTALIDRFCVEPCQKFF